MTIVTAAPGILRDAAEHVIGPRYAQTLGLVRVNPVLASR